ncbi:MAG: peptidylprolyl isomerase, partial [Polyangiaceae bacterium]|nr:peptidylprolyl isomerase [Polyangiaceae bacterium]
MFGSSNKGIMSMVYGGIVFAIAMVFIVQFRPNSGQQTASLQRQCVVNLRDRCIEPKEFHAALGLAVPRGADEKRVRAMGVRRQVIDGLVERSLLNQDAARLGLTVSDEEINAELVSGRFRVSLPAQARDVAYYVGLTPDGVRLMDVTSAKTSKFDYEAYKRVVRLTTNRSPNEFKEMQREEIIAARMRELIATRASVSDAEAFAVFQREKTNAKLEYVTLHRDHFAGRFLDTGPTAVQAWSKNHEKDIDESWKSRKSSYPPGCRKVRHIVVQMQSVTSPRGHERDEAQSLVEKARQRILAGDSFAEVAGDLSEDEGSAAKGGTLGCVAKGKLPKAFEDAVFAVTKPGMLETVVETPVGFHLAEVEALVPEDATEAERAGRALLAKELMTS